MPWNKRRWLEPMRQNLPQSLSEEFMSPWKQMFWVSDFVSLWDPEVLSFCLSGSLSLWDPETVSSWILSPWVTETLTVSPWILSLWVSATLRLWVPEWLRPWLWVPMAVVFPDHLWQAGRPEPNWGKMPTPAFHKWWAVNTLISCCTILGNFRDF